MQRATTRRTLAGLGAAVAVAALATAPAAAADGHGSRGATRFQEVDLVSNQPGRAAITDPNLVNAWGMSHGPNTPLWVSDNGADVATLYTTPAAPPGIARVPLVVSTPGGAPTGQVFNDTAGFPVPGPNTPAFFIFAGENGDLSAWNRDVAPPTGAVSVGHVDNGVLKGLALVHSPFGPLLLAADFHNNQVVVFDSTFKQLAVDRLFRDRHLPHGYAPFDVAEIGDQVYVTYAKQDAARHDDVAGRGHGFVDVYTNYGVFVRRLHDHDVLNSPWGLAVAPPSFGSFAGDVLVGNFGDGRIHAFDPHNGRLVGALRDSHGHGIRIDGLWGLIQGDPTAGGSDSLWFSAGPDGEMNGLLGQLRAA
jgi:uncharacterized protein (TIGR03118 family)